MSQNIQCPVTKEEAIKLSKISIASIIKCFLNEWCHGISQCSKLFFTDVCSIWLLSECRCLEDIWGELWDFPTMQVQTCITDESSKLLPDVLESPISSCNKGCYSVHHGSLTAVSSGHSSPCEMRSQWSHGCGMVWLHGEPSLTNAALLSVSEWGSSHLLLLGSGFTISRLGVSERGILEPHHFGSILLSHLF